jgi:hypothetical protein
MEGQPCTPAEAGELDTDIETCRGGGYDLSDA